MSTKKLIITIFKFEGKGFALSDSLYSVVKIFLMILKQRDTVILSL